MAAFGWDGPIGLLDQVPAAVVAVGLDHCVTLWSKGAELLYGWTAEEALGQPVSELFLAGQRRADVVEATHGGELWQGQMTVLHQDGHALLVHVRNAPLRDERGDICGVLGVSMDTEVLRRAEAGRVDVVADLAAEAARSLARTERLQRLTAALVPHRTVQEIAQELVRTGVKAVEASAGAVHVLSPDRKELHVIAARGYEPAVVQAFQRTPLSAATPTTDVVRSGAPLLFPDQQSCHARYPDVPVQQGFSARATIPITATGATVGVLSLSFAGVRTLDELDVDLLVTIARQCGQAFERARLLAAEQDSGRRNAFLARAGLLLAGSLDVRPTLQALTDLLVPAFADWVVVHVQEGDRAVARAAAHRDGDVDEVLRQVSLGRTLDTTSQGGTSEAMRTGRTVLHGVVPEQVRVRIQLPEPHQALTARLRPSTGLSVPMVLAGQVVGALSLAREDGPAYDAQDVALMEEVAARAAVALAHARDYERERERALTLQRSLLPRLLPELPGLGLEWRYLPGAEGALVGGDWYDVLPLDHGLAAVLIGDVMGSGIAAAALMGQLRSMARAYTEAGVRPGELLRRLDAAVRQLEQEAITTLLYAVVDPATCVVILASAGHLPPLLRPAHGPPSYLDLVPGPPLGAGPAEYVETRVMLPPESTLLMFTDGLVEERHQPVGVGMERLLASLANAGVLSPQGLCDAALAGTGRGTGDPGRDDDTALLAVAFVPSDVAPFLAKVVRSSDELSALRRELRVRSGLWQVPGPLADDLMLVLTELAANALLHAGGDVTVAVRLEPEQLRVEVHDGELESLPLPSLEVLTRARGRLQDDELDGVIEQLTETGTTGRGMTLVGLLASRWGVSTDAGGKVVWAELALAPHVVTEPVPDSEVEATAVRLLQVPVRLVLSSAASLDEQLREVMVTPPAQAVGLLGPDELTLVHLLARRREPHLMAAREALARGQRVVDLQITVSSGTLVTLDATERVVAEIAGLAQQGSLLAAAPAPEVVAFRRWWADQVQAQLAGGTPIPCPFPALPAPA